MIGREKSSNTKRSRYRKLKPLIIVNTEIMAKIYSSHPMSYKI